MKIYCFPLDMPKGKQADDQRTVTISIAKDLVEEIDVAARAEGRTRSNWIVYQLRKLMDARRQGKLVALPDAAHAGAEFTDSTAGLRVAEKPGAQPARPVRYTGAMKRKRKPDA